MTKRRRRPPEPARPADSGRRELLRYLIIATLAGIAAVILPVLARQPTQPGGPVLLRSAAEHVSVWTFHGFFAGGFVLGFMSTVSTALLPVLAVAMVAFFPVKAAIDLAMGSTDVRWPDEFIVYALWIVPALIGLYTGRFIEGLQRRAGKKS